MSHFRTVVVTSILFSLLFGFLLGFQPPTYSLAKSTSCRIIALSKSCSRYTITTLAVLQQSKIDDNMICRTIPISSELNVTVTEWKEPAATINAYWESEQLLPDKLHDENTLAAKNGEEMVGNGIDPFGLVLWPGAVVAAKELLQHDNFIKNKKILILGAGVGCEAQVAAYLCASTVLATDINPRTLQLLQYGAQLSGYGHKINTALFDIASNIPLSSFDFDFLLIADVLYNENLAYHVARRCEEAYLLETKPIILVTDSQRIVHSFENELNRRLVPIGHRPVQWNLRPLTNFTGSGVLIDGDQTYSVNARIIWIRALL